MKLTVVPIPVKMDLIQQYCSHRTGQLLSALGITLAIAEKLDRRKPYRIVMKGAVSQSGSGFRSRTFERHAEKWAPTDKHSVQWALDNLPAASPDPTANAIMWRDVDACHVKAINPCIGSSDWPKDKTYGLVELFHESSRSENLLPLTLNFSSAQTMILPKACNEVDSIFESVVRPLLTTKLNEFLEMWRSKGPRVSERAGIVAELQKCFVRAAEATVVRCERNLFELSGGLDRATMKERSGGIDIANAELKLRHAQCLRDQLVRDRAEDLSACVVIWSIAGQELEQCIESEIFDCSPKEPARG